MELDSVGGEFNAFTAKDKTMYYAKVDAKHLDRALDVVADMASSIPNHVLRVAESGIDSGAEIRELHSAGYQAFLIGETLLGDWLKKAGGDGQKLVDAYKKM